MAKLEAAIAARRQEEEEERLKREQEKDAAMRFHQKEKVKTLFIFLSRKGVFYLLQHFLISNVGHMYQKSLKETKVVRRALMIYITYDVGISFVGLI